MTAAGLPSIKLRYSGVLTFAGSPRKVRLEYCAIEHVFTFSISAFGDFWTPTYEKFPLADKETWGCIENILGAVHSEQLREIVQSRVGAEVLRIWEESTRPSSPLRLP